MKSLTYALLSGAHSQTMSASSYGARARITRRALSNARAITTVSKSRSQASALPASVEAESSKNIVESKFPKMAMPYAPLAQKVFTEVSTWSHKIAIECGITGRCYTYSQLLDGAMKFGGMLQQLAGKGKLTAPDNGNPMVAILSPNSPEHSIVLFGTTAVGAILTPINPTYTPEEVAGHLRDSGTEILVVDSLMEPLADAALALLQWDIPVIVNGASKSGRPNLREIITDTSIPYAQQVDICEETTAVLAYSSGTTGKPKGVCMPHSLFSSGSTIYQNPYTNPYDKAEGEHQEVIMGLLPFFHIYGMMGVMVCGMLNGAKIVTLPKFDPVTYMTVLKKHQVTCLHIVPPLLKFIAMSPAVSPADLASTHTVICGAAPVLPAAAIKLKEKLQRPIFFQEGYGMTEILCAHLTAKGEEKLGYCGKLMPNVRAKVLDLATDVALPPGAKGELCIHTPSVMSRYHNNPEATREVMDEEGWVRTGDVAIYDEEGNFAIIDRIKELIKVKGMQVSPSELEDILLRHPQVADVGIIGVEDEHAGEVPRAYVVRQGNVTEKELQEFMQSRVAPFKQLTGGIKFIDELPKNPAGKLLKKELKKIAQQE